MTTKKLNTYLSLASIVAGVLLIVLHQGDSFYIGVAILSILGAIPFAWVIQLIVFGVYRSIKKQELNVPYKSYYLPTLLVMLIYMNFGKKDCSKHASAYSDGYQIGATDKVSGMHVGGNITLSKLNQNGIYPNVASDADKDCFCSGYEDGFSGTKNEYEGK
jgi:hypothetical protein